jgi:hypothetical protein
MTASEWQESIKKLAAQFESKNGRARPPGAPLTNENRAGKDALARIKSGVLSSLQEDDARYYATAVLKKGNDQLKVATVAWQKEPLESWAARTEMEAPEMTEELNFVFGDSIRGLRRQYLDANNCHGSTCWPRLSYSCVDWK